MTRDAVSTLTWYLEQVTRVPLRTAQQEIDLAKRVQAGTAAAELLAGDEPERERQLRCLVRDGDRAAALLTEANLRLVIAICRRYRGRGLDLLDLVQEGNLGLMTAVRRFDPGRGFRFSTYASWWIRQAILGGLATRGRAVRLPLHAYELVGRMRVAEQEILQETGREATEDELAERLEVRLSRLREVRQAAREVSSLDAPIGDGDDSIGTRIVDPFDAGPEDTVDDAMARDALIRAISGLPPRERDILRLRFGLHDGSPRTLEEVGTEVGVTRERVRQIERRALQRLCQPRLDGLLDSVPG